MKYLIYFVQLSGYIDFCIGELKSLLSLFSIDLFEAFKFELNTNIKSISEIKNNCFENFPFVYIDIEDENILKTIADRSILIHSIQKIFSEGLSHEEVIANVKQQEIQPYLDSPNSFKFELKTNNSTVQQADKVAIYEKFSVFEFKGTIDLKKPQTKFCIIENYNLINDKIKEIKKIYFGVELYKIKNEKNEQRYCDKFNLSDRIYLGPTSADLYLAFLMAFFQNFAQLKIQYYQKANFGLCDHTKFVCDFFAGTGGLLALCFGVEINNYILQGWGIGRTNKKSPYYKANPKIQANIWTNFEQHGLQLPEILRFDSTNSNFRTIQLFDAIICDPPYGIRAQQQKAKFDQNEEENKTQQSEELLETDYKLSKRQENAKETNFEKENVKDQLALFLNKQINIQLRKVGLSCFIQDTKNHRISPYFVYFHRLVIPQHDNFILIDYCENYLSGKHTRYVLVYEKK